MTVNFKEILESIEKQGFSTPGMLPATYGHFFINYSSFAPLNERNWLGGKDGASFFFKQNNENILLKLKFFMRPKSRHIEGITK